MLSNTYFQVLTTQALYYLFRLSFRQSCELRYHYSNRQSCSGKRSLYTNARRWAEPWAPFLAHLSIFGLLPGNRIRGRSLLAGDSFFLRWCLIFFYVIVTALFTVLHSNVYQFARTRRQTTASFTHHFRNVGIRFGTCFWSPFFWRNSAYLEKLSIPGVMVSSTPPPPSYPTTFIILRVVQFRGVRQYEL
jgi:hypothetical protein